MIRLLPVLMLILSLFSENERTRIEGFLRRFSGSWVSVLLFLHDQYQLAEMK